MSTTNEHYSFPAPIRIRFRTRDLHPRRPRRTAEGSGAPPVMGPANCAPGVSIMGAAIPGLHPALMGGPDTGPRVSVMGVGDRGTRLDVFGETDLRFVGSLFRRPGNDR